MSATATQFLLPTVQTAAYKVQDTATIVQSPTTVGINDGDLYGMTPAQIQASLALLQSTGSDTVRIDIPWSSVEPEQGVYDWTQVDDIVSAAAADGIAIDADLNDTPAWAATPGTPAISGPPASDATFAAFASHVATRYNGEISAYEIWNEPNSYQNWSSGPNAAAYTALLQAAYPAIKSVDPSATVVAGVLGSVISFGNVTEDPTTFVSQMYAAGAAGYFDALSFHPYSYTQEFSQGASTPNSPLEQLEALRQLMVANGDGSKLIWATEYGLPTNTVSTSTQATYISDFLNAWSGLTYTGPSFIYNLQDTTASNELDPSNTFGIFNADGTPKPAEQVIAEFIAAHATTGVGTGLGTALGAVLQAVFQQVVQAYVQAYLNAIATLLSNAFAQLGTTVAAPLAVTAAVTVPTALVSKLAVVTPSVTPAVSTSTPSIGAAVAAVPAVTPAVTPSPATTPASTPSIGAAVAAVPAVTPAVPPSPATTPASTPASTTTDDTTTGSSSTGSSGTGTTGTGTTGTGTTGTGSTTSGSSTTGSTGTGRTGNDSTTSGSTTSGSSTTGSTGNGRTGTGRTGTGSAGTGSTGTGSTGTGSSTTDSSSGHSTSDH